MWNWSKKRDTRLPKIDPQMAGTECCGHGIAPWGYYEGIPKVEIQNIQCSFLKGPSHSLHSFDKD